MIHFRNAKIENSIITIEYNIDYSDGEYGYIKYDLAKKECIEFEYCEDDKNSHIKMWFNKAIRYLGDLEENIELPNEFYYSWF